jgi:hypothetical protein
MAIEKYLLSYADQTLLKYYLYKKYNYVLVIPAYNESHNFIKNLKNIIYNHKNILIIVIINYPDNNYYNNKLEELVAILGSYKRLAPDLKLLDLIHDNALALCGPYKLPAREGVGRARKIGCDWALSLIESKIIRCPLIFSTDADAVVPSDYFAAGEKNLNPHVSAIVFPFVHKNPPYKAEAIRLYEKRLNYYVSGLDYARSPYAFHTLGSAMAIKALSYAQVRGFPTRAAGEDFYLLNKLRKVGLIINAHSSPLLLSARVSDRVPFGTGPALKNILLYNNIQEYPIFYHPEIFIKLKEFLFSAREHIAHDKFIINNIINNNFLYKFSRPELLSQALKNRFTLSDRLKAFDSWFDGFMTLKFLHAVRDSGFGMCSLRELEKLSESYKVFAHE